MKTLFLSLILIPFFSFSDCPKMDDNLKFRLDDLMSFVTLEKNKTMGDMEKSRSTSMYIYYRGKFDTYCDILERWERIQIAD